MIKDEASSIGIIGGADGPTALFIASRHKLTLVQKIQKILFQIRKAKIEKHISDEHHTMEEVCEYIAKMDGFKEADQCSKEYQEEYIQMRASLMRRYAPELLGEYAQRPQLTKRDEAGIRDLIEQDKQRQRAANNIPADCFDIDLHIYKKETSSMQMHLIVETRYGWISGGVSGDKNCIKQFNKIYREIYKYYGVTKEDIEQQSERYNMLIKTLARR